VRYPRELRDDLTSLGEVLGKNADLRSMPIGQIADLRTAPGPSMVRNENWPPLRLRLPGHGRGATLAGSWERSKEGCERRPSGSNPATRWNGAASTRTCIRVRERLKLVLPITIFLIAFLLYATPWVRGQAGIVLLAVPVLGRRCGSGSCGCSATHVSIAAWVGMIALMGPRRGDGGLHAPLPGPLLRRGKGEGPAPQPEDLEEAYLCTAPVKRVRPKMMTVTAAFMGLMPIMWSTGTGADVMKRIAAPMVGAWRRPS